MGVLPLFIPASFIGRHLLVPVVFFLNSSHIRVYRAPSLWTGSSLTPPFAWVMHTSGCSHRYHFLWPSNSLSREVRRWDLGRSQGESSFRGWGESLSFLPWKETWHSVDHNSLPKTPPGLQSLGVSEGCPRGVLAWTWQLCHQSQYRSHFGARAGIGSS